MSNIEPNDKLFREATVKDIPEIQVIRHSVTENILSDPSLVTDADCEHFLMKIGKGWVCESSNKIVGFAIIDVSDKNIWALFVHPDHDRKGVGSRLHDIMLDWYFERFDNTLWLGTSPKTRAEEFYRCKGWKEFGKHGKGEIKFSMSKEDYRRLTTANS